MDSRRLTKVSDFGMSRLTTVADPARASAYAIYETSDSSTVRIPVRWSAPEVFDGCRFTTSGDVWSFGMLMIEVYTDGGVPFPEAPKRPSLE